MMTLNPENLEMGEATSANPTAPAPVVIEPVPPLETKLSPASKRKGSLQKSKSQKKREPPRQVKRRSNSSPLPAVNSRPQGMIMTWNLPDVPEQGLDIAASAPSPFFAAQFELSG